MARLLGGDFKGGFEDYEYRLVTSENKAINLGLPADKKWDGTDLTGKTILVHCEQGVGDTIQFLRFMPAVMERNPEKVILIPHNALGPMIAPMERVELRRSGVPLEFKEFDCWVALMSLPLFLGTEEATIPAPWVPVIERERTEKWRGELALPTDKLNIGVCWAGNFQHKNDRHRSIDLRVFGKLFDAEGCNFISLQQMRPGETETFEELKRTHPNLRAFWFDDFRDTAAAMLNLDRVVSVDTAVAHLSASLNICTDILIPDFSTDFRWQIGRPDSPWYPNARIWRQPKVGDWASVIASLHDELQGLNHG